jgi:outer membrane protein
MKITRARSLAVPMSLAFFVAAVSALAAGSMRVLTLDQCIGLAKRSSPGLRSAENALSSAALSQKALFASRLPRIRAAGEAGAAPTFGRFGYDPVITDYGVISARVVAEQVLYDGGVYGAKTKQMRLDLESLRIAQRISERDIASSIKMVFIEILRSREEIALQRRSVERLGDYLNLVRNLYAGAHVQYTDVLTTSIQLSSADASLRRAEEEHALAKYELAGMIGAAPDTSFEIAASLDSFPVAVPDTAEGAAFPQTLEVRSNNLGIQRSAIEAEITHREKFPTVSLMADAGLLTSLDPVPDRFNHIGYSAGISIQLPLIDWGERTYREGELRIAVENARYSAEAFKRSQAIELRSIILQIGNLRRRVDELRRTTADAEDNYLLMKSRYLGGTALASEVLAAQQLVTDSRVEELQARADILTLSTRLEQILAH